MSVKERIDDDAITDPIELEILRSRLEAVGEEAGQAVEKTAISTVVSESKDYSVTLCDASGAIIVATGVVRMHFGCSSHAVRATLARHGDSIAEGDVFIANDPHNDGGLHAQDVVVQRPIFVDGQLIAWSAISAHMMDMGGMAPGSWAPEATECYQEALRVPSVRLFRAGEEVSEVWAIFRNNVRIPDVIEMDMRSMVIGTHVVQDKVSEIVRSMGTTRFAAAVRGIDRVTAAELCRRVETLADGTYRSVDTIEWGQELYRVPCALTIAGSRLIFDLDGAPAQVPHIFNSKAFIIHSTIVELVHPLLAVDLPFTQALYDLIEVRCPPGTLVDSMAPAAVASAHMDCAMVVSGVAVHCLQLALGASCDAPLRRYLATPHYVGWGVSTWSFKGPHNGPSTFVLPDGVFGGTAAGHDRDGIDIVLRMLGNDVPAELPDVEIYEATYPLLFGYRRSRSGLHGAGRWRSGAGCQETVRLHGTDNMVGNLMGQRTWFPSMGSAGGTPGVTTSFAVTRADGTFEDLPMQAANVALGPDDWFEIRCGSGGGFGDPLDREPQLVASDAQMGRIDEGEAAEWYGVILVDGLVVTAATTAQRDRVRRLRLDQALPAHQPIPADLPVVADDEPTFPLYPGVIQRGPLALAEDSGAVLALAPAHWTDGCPRFERRSHNGTGVALVTRSYLDPRTGRSLHIEAVPDGEGRSFDVRPLRWMRAGKPATGDVTSDPPRGSEL